MDYQNIIRDIMKKVTELLKVSTISDGIVKVDYVGIFPQSDHDYQTLSAAIKQEALPLQVTPTGTIFKLNKPIEALEGRVVLVKICSFDAQQKRIGYVSYEINNFQLFKRQYLSTGSVEDIEEHEGEKLTVKNTEVMANFPETPFGKQFI